MNNAVQRYTGSFDPVFTISTRLFIRSKSGKATSNSVFRVARTCIRTCTWNHRAFTCSYPRPSRLRNHYTCRSYRGYAHCQIPNASLPPTIHNPPQTAAPPKGPPSPTGLAENDDCPIIGEQKTKNPEPDAASTEKTKSLMELAVEQENGF